MSFKKFLSFTFGLLVIGLGIFLISNPAKIAQKFESVFHLLPTAVVQPKTIGTLIGLTGTAQIRLANETTSHSAVISEELLEKCEVIIGRSSRATVRLSTGFDIELYAESRSVFELWNHNTPTSPILVSVLSGDLRVVKEGALGQLYILQSGQLFAPPKTPRANPESLIISESALNPWTEPLPKTDDLATPSVSPEESEKPTSKTSETLSNEYMDEVLAAQKNKFSHCQANSLRSNGNVKGQLTIGFRITSDGKTQEIKILSSTISDTTFQNCITEVIAGLKFNPFTGADIVRSFDLKFE